MNILHPCCAGLDVHKKTIFACIRTVGIDGTVRCQVRTFGTMTAELLALADWLESQGVRQVAMESTGVYWKPVFNLLEGRFEVILVNAQHIKKVPVAGPTSRTPSGSRNCSSTACSRPASSPSRRSASCAI